MRMVFLIISMAIAAYLTAQYLTHPSVMVPGSADPQRPMDVLDQTKVQTQKIELDMAKRAAAPVPTAEH